MTAKFLVQSALYWCFFSMFSDVILRTSVPDEDRDHEMGGEGKTTQVYTVLYTVEPLNKGHFGANSFVPCREVVPISEVKYYTKLLAWCRNKCPL